ncbi:MAG: glycosyltransferase family 39 protein [Thermoflexales bacterium]
MSARTYWSDESFTLYRVFGSWADLLSNAINLQGLSTFDIHPPLYFAALKVWGGAAGMSEFALRVFSAYCGVIVVPISYVLGRRLFGSRTGIFVALLAALCPAYEWYSWEVRMYSLMPMLAALATYLLVRALVGPRIRPRALFGWAVVSLISVLTHYSSVSLLLAHGLFLVPVIFHRAKRFRAQGVAALLVTGAASVVLAYVLLSPSAGARQVTNLLFRNFSQSQLEPVSMISIIHDVLGASTFGMNAADPTGGWLEAAIGLLVILGVLLPLSREDLDRRTLLAISIGTPIVFWTALSYILENRPSFRYVIIMVPAMQVVLGRVMARAWDYADRGAISRIPVRFGRAAIAIVLSSGVLGLYSFGLTQTFMRTSTWQDDWLALTKYLRQNWLPGDALIINLYTPEPVLRQFLGDVPIDILYAREWVASAPEAELSLRLSTAYTRVWHANTGGDNGYMSAEVRGFLQPFDRRVSETFPGRTNILQLDRYDTRQNVYVTAPPDARAIRPPVAPTATNPVAYRLKPGGGFGQTPSAALTLFWAPGRDAVPPASLSIRLIDKNGGVWMDWNLPADLGALPRDCAFGKVCAIDYTLLLPPGLPPIAYRLELTTLAASGRPAAPGVMLTLDASELACCLRVSSASTDKHVLEMADVSVADAEYPDTLHPGDPLSVVLTWRLKQPGVSNWTTRLSIAPVIGPDSASTERPAGPPDFPPSAWPSGELIRDQYAVNIPDTLKVGLYRLLLARTGVGIPNEPSFIGLVSVTDFPRSPIPTDIAFPVNGEVGEFGLLGYALDKPFGRGEISALRTLWRVNETPARDGALFVHILSPSGELVAQEDNSPERGLRSTLTYRDGEGLDQVQRLALPRDLPGGEYRVMVGIYDRVSGARWPAMRDGQPARDDLVPLMTFTLPEPPFDFRAFLPAVSAGDASQ